MRRAFLILVATLAWALPPAFAEDPAPVPTAVPAAPPAAPRLAPPALSVLPSLDAECGIGGCPTTTREKIVISVAGIAMFGVFFMLFRAAMVSALIRKEWSPGLASHAALSTALLAASIGTSITAYVVKGSWNMGLSGMACLMLGVWGVHLLFTLIAVRGSR